MAENKNIYSESISVKSYDSDMFKEMSIPAIMRYFQEIGGHQLATVGLPYEKMFADGAVFLLNCVDIHINRPIPLWQPLTIETWCYGVNGAIFTRNNRLKTADGEVMAEGSAGWFLVDPESHRIIRPKEYPRRREFPWRKFRCFRTAGAYKAPRAGTKALRQEGAFFRRRLQPSSEQHKICRNHNRPLHRRA